MPIEGFDYKAFALDLAQQALEILSQPDSTVAPSTLTDKQKKEMVETVKKFCLMAGEALSNDAQLKFNAEQASLVTQFIGEWTFHKSIDLITGKIPEDRHGPILQVIAANIFNTAKLAIIKNMPNDALISLVEEKVQHVYSEELKKLVKKGTLSEAQFDNAVNKSNLKEMVQKAEDEANINRVQQGTNVAPNEKKVLKLASLAIILRKLPQEKSGEILRILDKNDVAHVLNYMKMSDLEDKIDHDVIIKTLEEIKKILPMSKSINVEKLLKRHYRNIKAMKPKFLSKLALGERENVKDFILDVQFPAKEVFTPHIIKSLVTCIEEKINDN